jgi:thiol-disulfide isomerase/thioredoxin
MIAAMQSHRLGRTAIGLIAISAAAWLAASEAAAPLPAPEPLAADGLRALLDRQRGRVVLLNFWATWCRPCREEIPALMDLQARYADQGLVLVPVSLDEPDTAAELVPDFLERFFPDFRSWLSTELEMDTIVSVVDPAWNEVLPTSYVLGRDGSVIVRLQGGKPLEEFEAAVRIALSP